MSNLYETNLLMKKFQHIFLTLLAIFSIESGFAGNNITFQRNPYLYFDPYVDAATTVNKGSVQLAARKYKNDGGSDYDWYTAVTSLSNITNTRLYYTHTLHGPEWSGAKFHGWAFISNATAKGDGDTEYWSGTNSTWYSSFKTYGFNNNSVYLLQASSSTKGNDLKPSNSYYLGTHSTDLNYTQTIKYSVSYNNGSTYSEVTSGIVPATITSSSYKFVDGTFNAVSASTQDLEMIAGGDVYEAHLTAARTATTTLTASSYDGYTFIGWYAAASGGSALSTDASYTYYPTEAKTIYARFQANTYTGWFNNITI